MAGRRALVHTSILFLLPVVVAALDWSAWAAVVAVLLMLLWRWLIVLSGFAAPVRQPPVVLESISASHFVEKVRWNMDVAGIEYRERAAGGTLGAFFLGRTVPALSVQTGAVRSCIGNSPEILRYLWGAYAHDPAVAAAHLEPTAERLALEKRLDSYGRHLQVWAYTHLLDDRDATLRVWGAGDPAVPAWQRRLLPWLFPVLKFLIRRSFAISPAHHARVKERIETLLLEMDATLRDGRASILGDDVRNYTDYQFAAMTGLWLQPGEYGGPRGSAVRLSQASRPPAMAAVIDDWRARYPHAVEWVETTYAEDR